ncbi:MAG: putative porin, partial [Bacteroidaceae bacterium]
MSRHHILSLMLLIASCCHLTALLAQTPIRQMNPDINSGPGATLQSGTFDGGGGRGKVTWGRDTTSTDTETEIPIGQFQWRVDERLGTVIDALNNDTVVHNFQNWNLTDGMTGQYSILGNVGSPRLNRIFLRRPETSNFIFLQPFDHFRTSLSDFLFTNTKSPVT